MATIKKGKAAQPEERLLTSVRIHTTEKGENTEELKILLWNSKLERMETIHFTREETDRIDKAINP